MALTGAYDNSGLGPAPGEPVGAYGEARGITHNGAPTSTAAPVNYVEMGMVLGAGIGAMLGATLAYRLRVLDMAGFMIGGALLGAGIGGHIGELVEVMTLPPENRVFPKGKAGWGNLRPNSKFKIGVKTKVPLLHIGQMHALEVSTLKGLETLGSNYTEEQRLLVGAMYMCQPSTTHQKSIRAALVRFRRSGSPPDIEAQRVREFFEGNMKRYQNFRKANSGLKLPPW